jgi:hypothetical protein
MSWWNLFYDWITSEINCENRTNVTIWESEVQFPSGPNRVAFWMGTYILKPITMPSDEFLLLWLGPTKFIPKRCFLCRWINIISSLYRILNHFHTDYLLFLFRWINIISSLYRILNHFHTDYLLFLCRWINIISSLYHILIIFIQIIYCSCFDE